MRRSSAFFVSRNCLRHSGFVRYVRPRVPQQYLHCIVPTLTFVSIEFPINPFELFSNTTLAVLLHVFSRRGGIYVNNFFAVFKFVFLFLIVVFGVVKSAGANTGGDPPALHNFSNAFEGTTSSVSDFALALVQVIYTFSGFEQPFYVLGECRNPRKDFPKFTVLAMATVMFLFLLVNVAFFLVVPKDLLSNSSQDMATLFLQRMFGSPIAKQAMAALIAVTIFGNLVVMTFTASRVKQEIAREGVLLWSRFFAKGVDTPDARWKIQRARKARQDAGLERQHFGPERPNPQSLDVVEMQSIGTVITDSGLDSFPEQSPMPALLLHWVASIVLIAVTSMLTPDKQYNVLVLVYVYVIVVMVGFFVSGGLVFLRFKPGERWRSWGREKAAFSAWGASPGPALLYFVACGFILFAQFKKPYREQSDIPYYIAPAIGLSSLLWGSSWYGLLCLWLSWNHRELVVTRKRLVERVREDRSQLILRTEVVEFFRDHRKVKRPDS